MKTARLTIKNYRAFSDEEPLRIEIGPAFTAIVGPNNSGKSAVKLFFYELRNLFQFLGTANSGQPGLINTFVAGFTQNFNYEGITDAIEIFHNRNDRPVSVELELLQPQSCYSAAPLPLTKVVATCQHSNPSLWRFECFGAGGQNFTTNAGLPQFLGQDSFQLNNGPNVNCTDWVSFAQCLANARYFGPFRNAINQGAAKHFDLEVGTGFINTWNQWKTSGIKRNANAIEQITEDIRRLFNFDRLEINASTQLNTLVVSVDRQSYRLPELGSGLAQFILTLGNAAIQRPSLLLIDEPETNLHPALQIDFLLSLSQYARDGVLFSTHSIGLARAVAEHIYSVQKIKSRAVIRPFEVTHNYVEFLGELSFSAFKDLGSDRLLLVEGVTDVKTVQQLLRMVKKEHTTVVLPLGGNQLACGGRDQELSELKRLSNNINVLVDSERTVAGGPADSNRAKFAETCKRLNFRTCITERRALDNYFTDGAVKQVFGISYSNLGPYEALREHSPGWGKNDNWKIARAMKSDDLKGTDVGTFLDDL